MISTENINYPAPKQEYKVLVRCFTFNHSKYIEDALYGFAMQQTNFPFVCLVMDDASTDGEQMVIKKWMERECDMSRAETIDIPTSHVIIVPHKTNTSCCFAFYLLKQNLYGTGDRKMNHVYPWRKKCEYEALCEGDDYWIDPLKLQKQVDFLEENIEYSMCFHNAIEHFENYKIKDKLFSDIKNQDYEGLDIYKKWIVPTASVVLRKTLYQSNIYLSAISNKNFIHGDIVLFLSCAAEGKLKGFADVMSVYRRHHGGVTFIKTVKNCRAAMLHNKDIPIYFGKKYEETSKKKSASFALHGFFLSKFNEWYLLKKAFELAPLYTVFNILKTINIKVLNIYKRSIVYNKNNNSKLEYK